MIEKIAVIGGGSTGHGVAAVMAMRGFNVTLHDDKRFKSRFASIEKLGGILLRGKVQGIGKPSLVTTEPEEAIKDAELIFVNVMSDRHEEIAKRIAPFVRDGQHIMIIPGNLGSFAFRKVFDEMGVNANITLTEKEGNFFPCRLSGESEVTVGMPLNLKGLVASLPSKDTLRVLKDLEGVVEYSPNRNVLEGAINAGNVIMHIASTVLSSAAIHHQGDSFSLFKYGFIPETVKCIEKISKERLDVMEACGLPQHADNPMAMIEKVNNPDAYPENHVFREHMNGPNAIDHRYLHEDCGCGGSLIVSIGNRCNIATPVLTSFLIIAGTMNNRDYIKGGRNLENLGFSEEMTMEEIYNSI